MTKSKKHHKNLKQKVIDNETTSTQKPTKHHPKKYASELARKRRQYDGDDDDDESGDGEGSGITPDSEDTEKPPTKKTDSEESLLKNDKYCKETLALLLMFMLIY